MKIDETIDRTDALFFRGVSRVHFCTPKHPFEVCIAYVITSQGPWGPTREEVASGTVTCPLPMLMIGVRTLRFKGAKPKRIVSNYPEGLLELAADPSTTLLGG